MSSCIIRRPAAYVVQTLLIPHVNRIEYFLPALRKLCRRRPLCSHLCHELSHFRPCFFGGGASVFCVVIQTQKDVGALSSLSDIHVWHVLYFSNFSHNTVGAEEIQDAGTDCTIEMVNHSESKLVPLATQALCLSI